MTGRLDGARGIVRVIVAAVIVGVLRDRRGKLYLGSRSPLSIGKVKCNGIDEVHVKRFSKQIYHIVKAQRMALRNAQRIIARPCNGIFRGTLFLSTCSETVATLHLLCLSLRPHR